MAVIIKEISPNRIEVNGKLVLRNGYGEWVNPANNLTPAEETALYNYIKALELRLDRRQN